MAIIKTTNIVISEPPIFELLMRSLGKSSKIELIQKDWQKVVRSRKMKKTGNVQKKYEIMKSEKIAKSEKCGKWEKWKDTFFYIQTNHWEKDLCLKSCIAKTKQYIRWHLPFNCLKTFCIILFLFFNLIYCRYKIKCSESSLQNNF